MKNFIITIAAILLMTTIMVFQLDCNQMIQKQEQLKFAADECAATACIYTLDESFGEGIQVYNDKKAIENLEEMLKLNLKNEEICYKVSFEDNSGIKRCYENGFNLISSEQLISKYPTVTLELNAGKPKFRLFFFGNIDIIETSRYEYLGY